MASQFRLAPSIAIRALQTALPGALERWLQAERDQLVLWLPVALGLGIAAWYALPTPAHWTAFMLGSAGVAGIAAALSPHGRAGRAVAIFALLAALGCGLIWWRATAVAAPVLDRPKIVAFDARVIAIETLPAREAVRLMLAPAPAADLPMVDLPPRIRVNVDQADVPPGLGRGAVVRLKARLMPPPAASVPGGYDFARVAWFRGIGATGRALGPVLLIAPAPPEGLADIRARLTRHIQASLPGVEGGIATAFVTGDQGAIGEADADAMRASGLSHLLSISGLHVTAVVGGVMFAVMKLLALSPRLALRWPLPLVAAGAGALAGVGYTLLAGAEVPTVRSCVAAILVLAALAIGREALTLRLVAAGALVVLLLWPEALVGPSFQLSFAAVVAIIGFHETPRIRALFAAREEGPVARIGRTMLSLALTGIAIEIMITPIALYHFHRAGLYGAFANIVAIPLTTFIIMPLEALALLLDMIGLGAPAWWLAGKAIALLLWIARTTAGLPGAVAMLPSMPLPAFALIVGGGLWMLLWRTRPRWLGALPFAIGAAWTLMTPPPDLVVTGDGRHLALRRADDGIALLRPRARDYVRDMLNEAAGEQVTAGAIDDLPNARCSRDLCAADLMADGRRWRLLATRSAYLVDIKAMNAACASADIVVSDRRLPRSCVPRWLKLDRPALAETGGVAIALSRGEIRASHAPGDQHPWLAGKPPPVIPGLTGNP
jgi:competence protein ComEC